MKKSFKILVSMLLAVILIACYAFDYLCANLGSKNLTEFIPLQTRKSTGNLQYPCWLDSYIYWNNFIFYKSYSGQDILIECGWENGVTIENIRYYNYTVPLHSSFIGLEGMTELSLFSKIGPPSASVPGGLYAIAYDLYDGSQYTITMGYEEGTVRVASVNLHHPIFGDVDTTVFQICLCFVYAIVTIFIARVILFTLKKRGIIGEKKSTESSAP